MPVLSVVIPAYNEEQRLPRTIEQIERYLDGKREYELILVDDGSTDGMRQLMEAAAKRNPKVRVEALPGNRGKGRALASGVAVARGDEVLVTDADLSTPIEELEKLEDALRAGAGVAIGVGGAYDSLTGRVPRAPAWMRQAGLEWLFRLIRQPWRIKRIAVLPIYALRVLRTT